MKKLLLGLFVGLIGLINFGYCDYVGDSGLISYWSDPIPAGGSITFGSSRGDMICITTNLSQCNNMTITVGDHTITGDPYNRVLCLTNFSLGSKPTIINNNNTHSSCSFYNFRITLSDLVTPMTENECKSNYDLISASYYTSENCQFDYNLIPISSVDQNYCISNNLCPINSGNNCSVCPGSGDNWSALYINDIQHLGKPIINITFPDYLDWDYTTTDTDFNLDIVGYPVDTEYIDGIIRTQNYKPTSDDFTQLVGMLAPYSKYLLFLLFIFIIWAWIKKPFKSKKL